MSSGAMTMAGLAWRAMISISVLGAVLSCARGDADSASRTLWVARDGSQVVAPSRPSSGTWIPFVDIDRDGAFDPQADMSGTCDGDRCSVPTVSLDIRWMTQGGATTEHAGVLIWARGLNPLDHGAAMALPVCVDPSTCSTDVAGAFADVATMRDALWICTSDPAAADRVARLIVAGVAVPLTPRPHLFVHAARKTGGTIAVVATQSMDLVTARFEQAVDGRTEVRAQFAAREAGTSWSIAVPPGCDDCRVTVQAMHQWRDDWIHDRSEGVYALNIGADT